MRVYQTDLFRRFELWLIHSFSSYFVRSILCMLCLPHFLTFLRAFLRLILNGERWPAFGLVVVVVTIDALHSFGVVLLVSKVFPMVRTRTMKG